MHVVVVTFTSDRSETAMFTAWVAHGHRVTLLCTPKEPEISRLVAAGVAVVPIHIRNRLDLHAVWTLRKTLATLRPDVVYAPRNSSLAVSLMATQATGPKPVMIAYRGTCGHISRFDPAAWITYLHPRVHRIACVSEAVRDYLLGCGIAPERLVTIHKGHDLRWYDELTPPTRAALGLPADAFLLGFTGRMRPVKGGDVLLRAMLQVPRELNVHLVLVGENVDARVRALIDLPTLRDRVHTLGYRRDAAAIAGVFDAFAMPSVEREGLPRAVIEAMAWRVPPIVTRVGGMPELVQDGVSGLVVPPRDVQALAAAILELARDRTRARRLGDAARARIASHFDIDTTIRRYEALLRDAVSPAAT